MDTIIKWYDMLISYSILGNPLWSYVLGTAIFLVLIVVFLLIEKIVISLLRRYARGKTPLLDEFILAQVNKRFRPILYFSAFYLSFTTIEFNSLVNKLISTIGVIIFTYSVIQLIIKAIQYFLLSKADKNGNLKNAGFNAKGILPALNILVWAVGIIFILDNLGVNVSTVLTGLGIGGIAVALAAQAILGDLFSYFSIILDRPFEIGDFIIINDYLGNIEHIGLKTTRIRSLSGEQLIFSNTDLTSSRVRNYKRMEKRRVVFNFGLVYQTTPEQLAEVSVVVKNIIMSCNNVQFDRAHFSSFKESALNFEVVYYVLSGDFNIYMDIQQKINIELKKTLEAKGISFAYPTQTVYMG